jgi:hypothetical protein
MGTPAPDSVKRLVDHFDQNRKVFPSDDCQAGTSDWGLGTKAPNPNPQPLAPNSSSAALGWDMDDTIDTIPVRNWGSVPISPRTAADET